MKKSTVKAIQKEIREKEKAIQKQQKEGNSRDDKADRDGLDKTSDNVSTHRAVFASRFIKAVRGPGMLSEDMIFPFRNY